MAWKRADDARARHAAQLFRVYIGEEIRFVRQEDDIRRQRENLVPIDRRIARAITEKVPSAHSLDQIRYICVSTAPHPRLFPDRDDERKRSLRFAVGCELLSELGGSRFTLMNGSEK